MDASALPDFKSPLEFVIEEEQILKGIELIYSDKLNEADEYFDAMRPGGLRYNLHLAEVAVYVALISCEENDIQRANNLLLETDALANQTAQKFRSHSNIKKMNRAVSSIKNWAIGRISKKNLQAPTSAMDTNEEKTRSLISREEMIHNHRSRRARLWALQARAECCLMLSLLQIVGAGESWAAMVKLGYTLRQTWGLYQHCLSKLKQITKEWILMGGSFDFVGANDIEQEDSESEGESEESLSSLKIGDMQEGSSSFIMDAVKRTPLPSANNGPDNKTKRQVGSVSSIASIYMDQKADFDLDKLRVSQLLVLDSKSGVKEDPEISSLRIGLEFGEATFNILVSLIPTNYQKAFEVLGFPADRDKAMSLLRRVSVTHHPRASLASVVLLYYNSVILGLLPHVPEHAKISREVINDLPSSWKSCSMFRILISRLERYERHLNEAIYILSGNLEEHAIQISGKGSTHKLNAVVVEDLGWCLLLRGDFLRAAECFGKISTETVSFKPFFTCLQSACLWEADECFHSQAGGLLKDMPELIRRKKQQQLTPVEQYAVRISNLFITSNQAKNEAGFELQDSSTREKPLEVTETVAKPRLRYEHKWTKSSKMMCRFLLGLCQKHLGEREKADDNFRSLISNPESCSGNILAYSCYELGSMLLEHDTAPQEGFQLLDQCVNYPPHEFQGRLKFVVGELLKRYRGGVQTSSAPIDNAP